MRSSDNMEQDDRQDVINIAEAMQRLLDNKDFKLIFQEIFIDAYSITATQNSWAFDDQGRRRFLEKTISRGHFVKFIDDILEDGRNAIQSIHEESQGDSTEESDY